MITYIFFFFSSRRRHTRCSRDWSSDVCSSDLLRGSPPEPARSRSARLVSLGGGGLPPPLAGRPDAGHYSLRLKRVGLGVRPPRAGLWVARRRFHVAAVASSLAVGRDARVHRAGKRSSLPGLRPT